MFVYRSLRMYKRLCIHGGDRFIDFAGRSVFSRALFPSHRVTAARARYPVRALPAAAGFSFADRGYAARVCRIAAIFRPSSPTGYTGKKYNNLLIFCNP